MSGYMIYTKRKEIFSGVHYSFVYGGAIITAGIVLYILGKFHIINLNQKDLSSLLTFSAFIFWFGGIVLFYGIESFKTMFLPLLILVFMMPFPIFLKDMVISLLQKGSVEVFHFYLMLTGIPYSRDGFTFQLSGVSIEVAKQCSGVTSATALFVAALLSGHLYISSGWRKIVVLLSVFPIAILKNGLRIAVLSVLGCYVDKTYLTDSLLHSRGGIPFFVIALALLFPVVWFLRKSERRQSKIESITV
ncbi:hypothetical protein SCALIN_C13_0174 [Candidatus Scalindua japonica]|uniref:Exosortase n=2 Tax=Candidatus Scalindua japonica TaxID=1284222 RepID=A0A286TXM8_9BACT|nr:hypothetical protein SCALIN_C13_0174 [Candidatus Scalindua japonica]